MRLNIRTLNGYSYYSIIKDYTNIKGKRTTKIFEKLGNQKQVEDRFGKTDTINKIKEYINELNNEETKNKKNHCKNISKFYWSQEDEEAVKAIFKREII